MPPVVAATPADRENSNLLPLQIVSVPGAALLVVCLIAGVIFTAILQNGLPILIGAIVGLYLFFAIKVAKQWEDCADQGSSTSSRSSTRSAATSISACGSRMCVRRRR